MDRSVEVEKKEFDLSEVVQSMIVDYRNLTEANGLLLVDQIEKNIYIYGNRMIVQRVFDNFFTNALKYTSTQISVSLSEDRQFCYLSIADDGPGI